MERFEPLNLGLFAAANLIKSIGQLALYGVNNIDYSGFESAPTRVAY
jgi:hypothetical protein